MGVKAGNMAPPLKKEVKGGPHGREPITNKTKWMPEVRVDPSFCGVHLMSLIYGVPFVRRRRYDHS